MCPVEVSGDGVKVTGSVSSVRKALGASPIIPTHTTHTLWTACTKNHYLRSVALNSFFWPKSDLVVTNEPYMQSCQHKQISLLMPSNGGTNIFRMCLKNGYVCVKTAYLGPSRTTLLREGFKISPFSRDLLSFLWPKRGVSEALKGPKIVNCLRVKA